MQAATADFVRKEPNKSFSLEAVQFIARGITQIASILEDTDLHILMAKKAAQTDARSLLSRRE
jgi:hypothetical protein